VPARPAQKSWVVYGKRRKILLFLKKKKQKDFYFLVRLPLGWSTSAGVEAA
jgi:hypothetical protein